jgi:predicted oxidoreductase (fatty acid repression mutant protein)
MCLSNRERERIFISVLFCKLYTILVVEKYVMYYKHEKIQIFVHQIFSQNPNHGNSQKKKIIIIIKKGKLRMQEKG